MIGNDGNTGGAMAQTNDVVLMDVVTGTILDIIHEVIIHNR